MVEAISTEVRASSSADTLVFLTTIPYGYYPYPYYYPYSDPYPYYPNYPNAVAEPPAYAEPEQDSYWYYCQAPQGYYPYISSCPGGWTRVVPTPPQSGKEGR